MNSVKMFMKRPFYIALIVPLIGVVALEGVIRFFDLAPAEVPYWKTNPRGVTMRHKGQYFDVTYNTDWRGLRRPVKNYDGPRIVHIGDSYTFGWGVEDHETVPAYLSEILNANVINFGVPGTNPNAFYTYMKRYVPELDPQLTVVSIFLGRNTYYGGTASPPDRYVARTQALGLVPDPNPDHAVAERWYWRSALFRFAWRRLTDRDDFRYSFAAWPGPPESTVEKLNENPPDTFATSFACSSMDVGTIKNMLMGDRETYAERLEELQLDIAVALQ